MRVDMFFKFFVGGVILIFPTVAQAVCASPTANEGTIFYNTTVNAVQFCNGTNWVNTGLKVPTASGTSCTNPTADEGSFYYNTSMNNVQFCNGDNWVNMGTGNYSSATGTACTTPAAPEGSVFYNTTYKRVQFCNGDNWVNATYYPQDWFDGLQVHKLLASDGAGDDHFAGSVAIDGDFVVVGAHDDDDGAVQTGSAYIFSAITGSQLQKLTASDAAGSDLFGYYQGVAIHGDRVVVGAFGNDDNGSLTGSAYVFNVNTGAQLYKLLAVDAAGGDYFGSSVGLYNDLAIIGAQQDADNGAASGSAYIFNVSNGTQTHKLLSDDGSAADLFGTSVAIYDDVAVIGAPGDKPMSTASGSVYVFDASTGSQLRKFTATDVASGDTFGTSVDVFGDYALIGSPNNVGNGSGSGSAYIFNVHTGAQLFKLTPIDGTGDSKFGHSVSLDENKAVVGAYGDAGNGVLSGAAYVFDVATGDLIKKISASDGSAADQFGYAVAIDGNRVVIGSQNDDDNGTDSGSAYIFE